MFPLSRSVDCGAASARVWVFPSRFCFPSSVACHRWKVMGFRVQITPLSNRRRCRRPNRATSYFCRLSRAGHRRWIMTSTRPSPQRMWQVLLVMPAIRIHRRQKAIATPSSPTLAVIWMAIGFATTCLYVENTIGICFEYAVSICRISRRKRLSALPNHSIQNKDTIP